MLFEIQVELQVNLSERYNENLNLIKSHAVLRTLKRDVLRDIVRNKTAVAMPLHHLMISVLWLLRSLLIFASLIVT